MNKRVNDLFIRVNEEKRVHVSSTDNIVVIQDLYLHEIMSVMLDVHESLEQYYMHGKKGYYVQKKVFAHGPTFKILITRSTIKNDTTTISVLFDTNPANREPFMRLSELKLFEFCELAKLLNEQLQTVIDASHP